MTSQGFVVYENSGTPPTPATNYRGLFPYASGWGEIDATGAVRYFAKLDSDNASLTITGGFNLGAASNAAAGQIYVKQTAAVNAGIFEIAVSDHSAYNPVKVLRTRADGTAPNAGFGVGYAFNLEGFTNGSEAAAGRISAIWENNQTNDTTDRDAALVFYTMLDNAIGEAGRFSSGKHLSVVGGLNVGSATGAAAGNIVLSDGTRTLGLYKRTAANGSLAVGYDIAMPTAHVINLYGDGSNGTTAGGVTISYWSPNAGAWLAALSIRNAASTYSTLNLMPDGGTTNIGGGLNVGSATGASAGQILLPNISTYNAIQIAGGLAIGNNANDSMWIANNLYYSSGWKYILGGSQKAFQMYMSAGQLIFYSAPASGGVGAAATLTQVGYFDSTGFSVSLNVGFYNTAPTAKQTVTGSRGGNAALASLLTALSTIGLITNSSSA